MELAEVLARRRMRRDFTGAPVDPVVLDGILAAAITAPSAGNTQGWDAVVLVGPAQTIHFWDATTTEAWRASSRRWPGLRRAPVVVALFADPGANVRRYAEEDKARSGLGTAPDAWPVPYWFVDAGHGALLLMLAAADAGLGAGFLGNFRGEDELGLALGVPGGRRYAGAVLIGEAGTSDPPSASVSRAKRAVGERFHRGRW